MTPTPIEVQKRIGDRLTAAVSTLQSELRLTNDQVVCGLVAFTFSFANERARWAPMALFDYTLRAWEQLRRARAGSPR